MFQVIAMIFSPIQMKIQIMKQPVIDNILPDLIYSFSRFLIGVNSS